MFPPPSGLSYSTWFCVERFSSAPQAHPVRLLTVVRRATTSEQHYVCLAVVLSAKDRSLTVSTKEELLQTYCEYNIQQAVYVVKTVNMKLGTSFQALKVLFHFCRIQNVARNTVCVSLNALNDDCLHTSHLLLSSLKQRMSQVKKPPSMRSCPAAPVSAAVK